MSYPCQSLRKFENYPCQEDDYFFLVEFMLLPPILELYLYNNDAKCFMEPLNSTYTTIIHMEVTAQHVRKRKAVL